MQKMPQLPILGWMKRHSKALAISIIVISLIFLVAYAILHPTVITNLLHTNPWILLILLLLYILVIGTQFLIMYATIRLCKKDLAIKSGVFLSIYSAVANFFGPLQSGPGVRAIYLKQKIGLRIRDYTMATLFYYFAFAAINGSLLFINSAPILTVLGLILGAALTVIGVKRFHFSKLSKYVFAIFIVTIVQILVMTTIYFVELHAINALSNYSYLQSLVYSASANLSMFVAITPGAIGIREAFIVFAQSLHHIPLSSIISAGILDRAFYIIFLILLFIVSSTMHLKDMFSRHQATKVTSDSL